MNPRSLRPSQASALRLSPTPASVPTATRTAPSCQTDGARSCRDTCGRRLGWRSVALRVVGDLSPLRSLSRFRSMVALPSGDFGDHLHRTPPLLHRRAHVLELVLVSEAGGVKELLLQCAVLLELFEHVEILLRHRLVEDGQVGPRWQLFVVDTGSVRPRLSWRSLKEAAVSNEREQQKLLGGQIHLIVPPRVGEHDCVAN
eukprot:2442314-Prymnesium_polylepis.2